MKNSKGFTLVEVLAILVILLSVIAIITPKVISQFHNSEQIIYEKQIETIIHISQIYMNNHIEFLPENNDNHIITIENLKQENLIHDSDIINPKTKEKLTGCVVVRFLNNKYQYDYIEDQLICNE